MTKALQLHPREPSLWVYAAAWEFEHNRNAAASRALMQRGLRMCPDSPELWAEYFRMELLYAHMLRARREILGIASLGTTLLPNTLLVTVFATSACRTQPCEGVLASFRYVTCPVTCFGWQQHKTGSRAHEARASQGVLQDLWRVLCQHWMPS